MRQTRNNWGQSSSQQAAGRSDYRVSDPKHSEYKASNGFVKGSLQCKCQREERKGDAYHCDEKWSVGHKCKSMKLYLIEEVPELKEGDCEIEEDEEESVELGKKGLRLPCVLLGSTSPSTMRVIAIINGQKAVVLIDTGSTHNFMDKGLQLL
jgi:hypothetical protein